MNSDLIGIRTTIGLSILVFLTVLLSGCNARAVTDSNQNYPQQYQQLNESYDKPETSDSNSNNQIELRRKFDDFIEAHANLKSPDMVKRIEAAYAPELYFNDTLRTLTSREELVEYLVKTAEKVDYNRVQIHDIVQTGDGYYVRWAMQTGFTVFNKAAETQSIGMSHIRLDQNGKINFHQDFWDNTEGFFRHLPVVGYLIRKTKQRL